MAEDRQKPFGYGRTRGRQMSAMSEEMLKQLKQFSFANVGVTKVSEIRFDPTLRELCEKNSCGRFNTNYAGPPLCGDVVDLIARAKTYEDAIVFQNIYELEDSFDIEGMDEAGIDFQRIAQKVKVMTQAVDKSSLFLGAGCCRICDRCAFLDKQPCRCPDLAYASLEAYGIFVSDLAQKTGMKYINGQNTVTYFGAILMHSNRL